MEIYSHVKNQIQDDEKQVQDLQTVQEYSTSFKKSIYANIKEDIKRDQANTPQLDLDFDKKPVVEVTFDY